MAHWLGRTLICTAPLHAASAKSSDVSSHSASFAFMRVLFTSVPCPPYCAPLSCVHTFFHWPVLVFVALCQLFSHFTHMFCRKMFWRWVSSPTSLVFSFSPQLSSIRKALPKALILLCFVMRFDKDGKPLAALVPSVPPSFCYHFLSLPSFDCVPLPSLYRQRGCLLWLGMLTGA